MTTSNICDLTDLVCLDGKAKQHKNLTIVFYLDTNIDTFDLNDLKSICMCRSLYLKYNAKIILIVPNSALSAYLLELGLIENFDIINSARFESIVLDTIKQLTDKIICQINDSGKKYLIKINNDNYELANYTKDTNSYKFDYLFVSVIFANLYSSTHLLNIFDTKIFDYITNYLFYAKKVQWIDFNPICIKYYTTKKSDVALITKVYPDISKSDPRFLSIRAILSTGIYLKSVIKFICNSASKKNICYQDLDEIIKIDTMEKNDDKSILTLYPIKSDYTILIDDNSIPYICDNKYKLSNGTILKSDSNIFFSLKDGHIIKISDQCDNYIPILPLISSKIVYLRHYLNIFPKQIIRDRDVAANLFIQSSIETIILQVSDVIINTIGNVVNIDGYGYYAVSTDGDDIILSAYHKEVAPKHMH